LLESFALKENSIGKKLFISRKMSPDYYPLGGGSSGRLYNHWSAEYPTKLAATDISITSTSAILYKLTHFPLARLKNF
jgi:hypothetical protein